MISMKDPRSGTLKAWKERERERKKTSSENISGVKTVQLKNIHGKRKRGMHTDVGYRCSNPNVESELQIETEQHLDPLIMSGKYVISRWR